MSKKMLTFALCDTGRAAMLKAVKDQGLTLAWGSGSDDWVEEDYTKFLRAEKDLHNELARRKPTVVTFCTPDPEGEIILPIYARPDGTTEYEQYRRCEEATAFLYVKTLFDFEDNALATIREMGVFVGAEFDDSCPVGQRYFKPHELKNKGLLWLIQRADPILTRNAYSQTDFGFVFKL